MTRQYANRADARHVRAGAHRRCPPRRRSSDETTSGHDRHQQRAQEELTDGLGDVTDDPRRPAPRRRRTARALRRRAPRRSTRPKQDAHVQRHPPPRPRAIVGLFVEIGDDFLLKGFHLIAARNNMSRGAWTEAFERSAESRISRTAATFRGAGVARATCRIRSPARAAERCRKSEDLPNSRVVRWCHCRACGEVWPWSIDL